MRDRAVNRQAPTLGQAGVQKRASREVKPRPANDKYPRAHMTARLSQVECLMARGLSDKEIATALKLAYSTIKGYLCDIKRLGGRDRKTLLRDALRRVEQLEAALREHQVPIPPSNWAGDSRDQSRDA